MAARGRAHLVKASLLAVFLLVLLNFYNYRLDSSKSAQTPTVISMLPNSALKWPKRTRTSVEMTDIQKPSRTQVFGKPPVTLPTTHQSPLSLHSNVSEAMPSQLPESAAANATFAFPFLINQTNDVILYNKQTKLKDDKTVNERNVSSPSVATSPSVPGTELSANSVRPNLMKVILTKLGLNTCPPVPPNLEGPLTVKTTAEPLAELEQRFAAQLLPGGWYRPTECTARDRVAIVIPYRDRAAHLPIFLANLHPMLMRQQIEYGIFLIEQSTEGLFNRATLMNIGFVEALRLADWDCFIFHDIDLLPLDDRNLYTCPDQPRHMSVAVDTMGFKLPYKLLFGGVSALTVKQFRAVNGFSNSFWGWGGEDDDMSNRLKHVGFHIARYPINIARYTMLNHRKEKANPKRYENLVNGAKKYDVDGLNSLRYQVQYLEKKILYTWIVVKIEPEAAR